MELFELLNGQGMPLCIKDVKQMVQASGRSVDEFGVIFTADGGIDFVHCDEDDFENAIPLVEVLEGCEEENPDVPDEEILLYIGTDDEGQRILASAPLGHLARAEYN